MCYLQTAHKEVVYEPPLLLKIGEILGTIRKTENLSYSRFGVSGVIDAVFPPLTGDTALSLGDVRSCLHEAAETGFC
jgi:hypothetical protein